jgi:hypothetical protein
MIDQMSKREKTLALLVGGVVFLLINVVVLKFFIDRHGVLKKNAAEIQAKINALKLRDQDRDFDRERDTWLNAKLPTIGDSQVAARDLTKSITEIARKHDVVIETPMAGNPRPGQYYSSLGARVIAKGTWKAIFFFLQELQSPEKGETPFVVLDPVDLKVDITDKTLMRAEVMVTRWFKP